MHILEDILVFPPAGLYHCFQAGRIVVWNLLFKTEATIAVAEWNLIKYNESGMNESNLGIQHLKHMGQWTKHLTGASQQSLLNWPTVIPLN